MNDQQKAELQRLFEAGLSDEQIADKMFYSISRVKRVREHMGLMRGHNGGLRKWPKEKILQMLRENKRLVDIGREIGCRPEVALYYKKKYIDMERKDGEE